MLWRVQGGESKGLARLTKSLEDKDWVVQFEKPKGNPAALEPATTVLSPYMKFGCVSARLFYAKLIQVGVLVQVYINAVYVCGYALCKTLC